MSRSTTHQELTDRFQKFLRGHYHEDVLELANKFPREQQSIEVDWMDLYKTDRDLAEDLVDQPDRLLELFDEALRTYDLPIDINLAGACVSVENARHESMEIGEMRARHIGEYVAINGQVSKTSAIHPKVNEAAFECQRCGTLTYIVQKGGFQEPHECEGCERQGPFVIDFEQSDLIDHQAVRLQEPPESSKGGEGEHIDVDFEGGIVGCVSPGDRVNLSGIYRVKQETKGNEKTRRMEPFLDGRAAEIEQADFEEIDVAPHLDRIHELAAGEDGDPYELLASSLAPKIRGRDTIKEALILQLFGGWRHEHPDGTIDRGDSHVLLIGDPGAGKSMLLRAVEELAPRSVFASGKGLTKAGATAAAVKDDFGSAQWGLEAGALVLANKGIACIDELDKVNEDAVSSLHSALESQRVSVNKAGINATLPAQTALLAAGNPEYGRFDRYESIAEQIDLAPTLISRFDLIFTVTDDPDEEKDRDIAQHIVRGRQTVGRLQQGRDVDEADREAIEPTVERETLRAYIAHAKQTVFPTIEDPEVESALIDFFTGLRTVGGQDDSPVPVTFRKLEAIQRLAEASARVRLSDTIEMEDVKRATTLVTKTMRDVGVDPETGEFDADVVETGTSKTQRDRIKTVKQIIAELEAETAHGAPIDEIISKAEENGINEAKTEHEMEKLSQRGEIYEPETGYIRTT
jgi:replicative DNA helicase Mcm